MTDRKRHGLVLLLVVGLIAASVVVITTMKTTLGLDLKGGVELTYKGQPTPQQPVVTQEALNRAVDVMNSRVNSLGVTQPQIQTESPNLINVQLPDVHNVQVAEKDVGTTAQLFFYDWEANVLTPSGHTAANQLPLAGSSGSPALTLSQGQGGNGVGSTSAAGGAMGLYQAVKLASKQPYHATRRQQNTNQYFLFGAPGSSACKAYYAATGKKPMSGVHCLITQPLEPAKGTSYANAVRQLESGLSKAETTGAEVLVVKRGTVVLQGVPNSFEPHAWPPFGAPNAGYYVLKDDVALHGNQVSNPEASTDPTTSQPDVTFGFTNGGANAFAGVTKTIAQRGNAVSLLGNTWNQHFAIALDNQLISVPEIQYKTYPDGISGSGGSEISGGFTASSAEQLAQQLRLGALPIKLVQISESQVSSTLGSEALHAGLLGGAAGLVIVILFLIAYYRVLGLIATGGLIAYGLYFFALIKLIPITMTLAGIAGLILTIGVAADANIVIFERVKEEIRAGRSVRTGIATGYRKGLTAIIDANVVTIITAFILFVLATSDVKGFAFTLGVGVFVSLFTAVLATQAILMTLGDSRMIQSPSALGAGSRHHVWRFDFMGKSRYFFSMSGVILLIGALAIGGRHLNLGIDFTSGTQLSFGLDRPASVDTVKSLVAGVGGGTDATVQAIKGSKTLGPNGFQISSKYLGQDKYTHLRNELSSRYGIKGGQAGFVSKSVGPTFGSDVTHSAVVALIISLLVISIYVALRFEWKFAIPVMIALMHDILISVGVYALTGRVVSADTVAAILTILGYSMYDTIIVFDRVRENVPRMPRAAFSQIVNRSMSEVLTRSLATTSCTLLPVLALLLFGGTELKDFAFALLIGVASGAYSSIFIASPVLTHWKEREPGYRARRERIIADLGYVPSYASGGDIEPRSTRVRRSGRITTPQADNVSTAEFEQMKRDLGLEDEMPSRRTSTLTRRLARTDERELGDPASGTLPRRERVDGVSRPLPRSRREQVSEPEQAGQRDGLDSEPTLPAAPADRTPPPAPAERTPAPAPDEAENDGVARPRRAPVPPRASKNRSRRRHGRR